MKNKVLLVFLALVLVAVPLFSACKAAPAPPTKPIELSLAGFTPATSTAGQVAEAWAKGIEEATGGRVIITRYWGGTLLKGKNMHEGVIKGIADIGYCVFGYTPGRFPLWQAMSLPVGFPDTTVANRVQWEVYQKFKPKELADTKVCSLYTCSPCSIWSKVPIRTLEDFQGVELRATGFCAKMVEALGGVPVGAPQPEVYEMLAKGIVDGTWSSLDVIKSYKQADVTDYVILNGLYVSQFYIVMNLDTWNSLPADIQKIIDDFAEEHVEMAGEFWEQKHKEGLQYAKDQGLEIITLSPAELARWKEAVKPMLDDYVKRMETEGLPGREFLDEIIRLNEKYSK